MRRDLKVCFSSVPFSPDDLNLIVWIAVTGLAKPFRKFCQEAEINFEIISLICEELQNMCFSDTLYIKALSFWPMVKNKIAC